VAKAGNTYGSQAASALRAALPGFPQDARHPIASNCAAAESMTVAALHDVVSTQCACCLAGC